MRYFLRLSWPQRAMLLLALLGAVFMAYLTKLHYQEGGSSFCDFGAGLSCQIVNQSIYSELLGIPVSVLGIGYFVTVFALIALRMNGALQAITLFTVGSLVFSFYLTYVEARLLATFCLFCEGSKVAMLAILGAAHVESRRTALPAIPFAWYAYAILGGALMAAFAAATQR